MPGVIVDIGTGDGKFAYALAKAHPDRFIIGIDPAQSGMVEVAAKVYKKPAKGGIENALFVLADVENLPAELDGMANQVFINFPWSSLLKNIILVEEKTWSSIYRICQPGAYIDVVFGYESKYEPTKTAELGLPELSLEYLQRVAGPKFRERGLEIIELREMGQKEVAKFPSTWAKKLSFGRDREYFYLRLQVRKEKATAALL